MNRIQEWRYNGYYKKWELYLFRLFKLADYVESILRLHRLNAPEPKAFLEPEGYKDGSVIIPPNPFLFETDDLVFFQYYDDLSDFGYNDTDKDYKKLLREIWDRIAGIKRFLGITKGTRYIGEEREEWRLINELNWYIKYPDSAPMIYRVILGDPIKSESMINKFKNLLKDRGRIRGTKSLKFY